MATRRGSAPTARARSGEHHGKVTHAVAKRRRLNGKGKAGPAWEAPSKEHLKAKARVLAKLLRAVPGAPSRNRRAYRLFAVEVRQEMAAKTDELTLPEVSKVTSERWHALEDWQKKHYEAAAAADQARYDFEMESFMATDAYRLLESSADDYVRENFARRRRGEPDLDYATFYAGVAEATRQQTKAMKERDLVVAKLLEMQGEGTPTPLRKPPPSAYSIFLREVKPKLSITCHMQLTKRIGELWNALSAAEKARYEELARKEAARHAQEIEDFRSTQSYREAVAETTSYQEANAQRVARDEEPLTLKAYLKQARKEARGHKFVATGARRAGRSRPAVAAKASIGAEASELAASGSETARCSEIAMNGRPSRESRRCASIGTKVEAAHPRVTRSHYKDDKDPFWDSVHADTTLDEDDLMLNDRIALAAARRGDDSGRALLTRIAADRKCATSLFRRWSADCQETALHFALLNRDVETLQTLARDEERGSKQPEEALPPPAGAADGAEDPVGRGATIWYNPRGGGSCPPLRYRSKPDVGSKEEDRAVEHGQAVHVEERRGNWVRVGAAWLPLLLSGVPQFVLQDPEGCRERPCLERPELQPTPTGRAFRTKLLWKANLARGEREAHQAPDAPTRVGERKLKRGDMCKREGPKAFVRDLDDNYCKPAAPVSSALRWAAARGVDYATLAACCELFGRGAPADCFGEALRFGQLALARELLAKSSNTDSHGLTRLHNLALKSGANDEDLAEASKKKPSVTKKAQDHFGVMPLHCACANSETKLLKAMVLALGPGVEDATKDAEERTLLHYAAACESDAPVALLLEFGFSPHRVDRSGVTPLMCACMANRPLAVKRLLAAGANCLATAHDGTCFHLVAEWGATEALEALLGHIGPFSLASKGALTWARALTSSQQNALHVACAHGKDRVVHKLLDSAPNCLHSRDNSGRTPLIWAVMNGHSKLASSLLARRARVDQADTSGNTPLHYALGYGWREAALLLVGWKHKPDKQNIWHNSLVDVAISKGQFGAAVSFVRDQPISPDERDHRGRTLLTRACASLTKPQWRRLVHALVEHRGADVNLADGSGNLPLCLATRACSSSPLTPELEATLKALCAAKADVVRCASEGSLKGESALAIAMKGSSHRLFCFMLQTGAGAMVHGRGETLLHMVVVRLITVDAASGEAAGAESSASVLEVLRTTVPGQALVEMARTPDKSGLLPIHAAVLRFNDAIAMVRRQACGADAEVLRFRLREYMTWLRDVAKANFEAPVRPLEAPWTAPQGYTCSGLGPMPRDESEIVERSVAAYDSERRHGNDQVLGLATPLLMLVVGGDAETVTWLLDELHKTGSLERSLATANLYGITPLAAAVHQFAGPSGLPLSLLRSLATPEAASVRMFDGSTVLHAAATCGAAGQAELAKVALDSASELREETVAVGQPQNPTSPEKEEGVFAKHSGCEQELYNNVCAKSGVTPVQAESNEDSRDCHKQGLLAAFKVILEATTAAGLLNSANAKGHTALHVAIMAGPSDWPTLEPLGGSGRGFTAGVVRCQGIGKWVGWKFDSAGAYVNTLRDADRLRAAGVCKGMRLEQIEDVSVVGKSEEEVKQIWSAKSGTGPNCTFTLRSVAKARPGEFDFVGDVAPHVFRHCWIRSGRWYLELGWVRLDGGKLGLVDASDEADVRWATPHTPWPRDCRVGVALDVDNGEVRFVVNDVWEAKPALEGLEIVGHLSLVVAGSGTCVLSVRREHFKLAAARSLEGFRPLGELMPSRPSRHRIVGALLAAHASVELAAEKDQSPLHLAVAAGDVTAAQRLCEARADVNARMCFPSFTPLHLAMETMGPGTFAMTLALLEARADVDAPDPTAGNPEIVPHKPAQRVRCPRTVLHAAVEKGPAALVKLLLEARADANAPMERHERKARQCWVPLPTDVICVNCPKGHSLEPLFAPAAFYTCDDCGKRQPFGANMAHCRGCRHAKCANCIAKAGGHVWPRNAKAQKVALRSDAALSALASLDEVDPEKLQEVKDAVAPPLLIAEAFRELGDGRCDLSGGDLKAILEGRSSSALPFVVPRELVLYLVEVESVDVTLGRPLHYAAKRNDDVALRALLNARADPSVSDTFDGRLALHHAVEQLNIEAVQALIAAGTPLDVQDATPNRAVPLRFAVQAALAGNGLPVLRKLLAARATVDAPFEDGRAALHHAAAARNAAVIDELLQQRADPAIKDPGGRTPLHDAVNAAAPGEPSFDVERRLLAAGAPVNAFDKHGRTPLHYAFVKRDNPLESSSADPVETVACLCGVEGVLVDVADEFGATPLLCAARRGATISSLYLAKRGASLQSRDMHGNDALGLALLGGHTEYAVTFLSQHAGDIQKPARRVRLEDASAAEATSGEGEPAAKRRRYSCEVGPAVSLFHEAAKNAWFGFATLLLEYGFPFHQAIQDAMDLGQFRLVLTLLNKISPAESEFVRCLDSAGRNLLHVLADSPHTLDAVSIEIAEVLSSRGVLCSLADSSGRAPLHGAVANGHLDFAKWLLDVGGDGPCRERSAAGQTPLQSACTRRWMRKRGEALHKSFLSLLLGHHPAAVCDAFVDREGAAAELGAAGAAADDRGELDRNVPIVNAAGVAYVGSVMLILGARADCNLRDGRGETALCIALKSGSENILELMQVLLAGNADPNLRDGLGDTPLRSAIRASRRVVELVTELVRAGARINDNTANDSEKSSLVLDAIEFNPGQEVPAILPKLLELLADPERGIDRRNRPPLLHCVDERREKVVNLLLAARASAVCADSGGRLALVAAIASKQPGLSITLLQARADPSAGRDSDGRRPLMSAVLWGHDGVVEGLLRARALPKSAGLDGAGRGALSIAVRANAGLIAEALLEALADPRSSDSDGCNAAHHCVQPLAYGSYENAWLLLAIARAAGGKEALLAKDVKGMKPLQYVVQQGSGTMAAALTRSGVANVSISANAGHSALVVEPPREGPDVERDAGAEIERLEANAVPAAVPVHAAYGMAGDSEVWTSPEGVEHDAMLLKVGAKRDEKLFFHIQLVHEVTEDSFVLFTRKGEVGGEKRSQKMEPTNREDALAEFCKVFRDKTGNNWATKDTDFERKPHKYQLLRRQRAFVRGGEFLKPIPHVKVPCRLPRKVRRTVGAICDPEKIGQAVAALGVKAQSMPLGCLSRTNLEQARQLLGQIQQVNDSVRTVAPGTELGAAAKKRSEALEQIFELSSRYFELLPRESNAGEVARPLEEDDVLKDEFDAVLDLTDVSAGVQVLLGVQSRRESQHPLDYCMNALGVALEEVDPSSSEYALLLRYAQNTCEGLHVPKPAQPEDFQGRIVAGRRCSQALARERPHDTITAIYRLARRGGAKRFAPSRALHNRRLLWHGARFSHLIGILSQGLRVAPPEAPESRYMFGKGIYFADMYSKSRRCCQSNSNNEAAYMLLCEVALGDMYPSRRGHYMDKPQEGTRSTWGVGQRAPDWSEYIVEPGGAALPAGRHVDAGAHGVYHLDYNEFVVYDPAQVRARYLIELNNFECPEEVQGNLAPEPVFKEGVQTRAIKRARRAL